MATVTHVKATIHGKYKHTNLAGEEWSFSCDFVPILGHTLEDIWSVDPNFDASYTPSTTSGTGYVGESNFILEGGATDIDVLSWLEDNVMPAAIAYIGATNMFVNDVYIDSIDAWPYTADGKVAQLPVGAAYATITPTVNTWDGASAATFSFAPFTSYAVSKETIANVPRGRGRWYPPHNAAYASWYDVDGLLLSAGRTAHAAAAKAYLEGCQATWGVNDSSIWPVVIGAPYTTAYKITAVSVDNIPDTQRRRKASLATTRTQSSLSY